MKEQLKNITSIRMGYPFRTRIRSQKSGDIHVIQMKDLNDENFVDCSGLVLAQIDKVKEHHFIQTKDLIFRSRGQSATTAILMDDLDKAVVAAPLILIRVSRDSVLPEYLNWFFSQIQVQKWFTSRREGTHGGMISKLTLENLEIDIPSIDKQRKILDVDKLLKKERNLTEKILEKRNQFISSLLMQLAKGE